MELKNMTKEEIELMSYTDLTYMILKENKKSMNTAELFKKICDLLELGEDEFSAKIGDYYTSLTIDKRFYMLENAEWDLSEKHKIEMEIDDEETEIEEQEEEEENLEEELEENIDDMESLDDDLDDLDDDTLDLSIVTDNELEENE